MPRTRRPQSGVARPAGRVASTTTSSTVGVPSAQVYRIPTGKRTDCDVRNFEIAGKSPIVVRIEGTDVYRISLDEAALKEVIQGYEELDLSRVELTLGTINGPLTVDGDLSVENGTFTTADASIENLKAEEIDSVEITVQTLNADTAEIKSATIDEETVGTSDINKAVIAEEEVTKSTVEEAVIEDATITKGDITEATIANETVEESEIKKATIEEENVTKSTINQLGANQAHATSLTAVQATVSKEFISNGTATFNGENTFNTDAKFNESISVAGNSDLTKLNVSSTATLDGQLNANGNANFAKNTNVEGTATFNSQVVNGYSIFNDRATFNEDTVFNDTISVNANATFNGHTAVKTFESTGEATFKDAVQMDKNLNVDGNAVIEGNERIDGSLSVGKESEFKSHLNVIGKVKASNADVAGTTVTTALETDKANIQSETVVESKIKKLTVTEELVIPDEALAPFQARSEKDKANGYAGLDENGKILIDELPESVTTGMHYKGGWEPSSTYPSNPKLGDTYKVVANGVKDGVEFTAGDTIIYNGSSWDLIPSANDVVSVNGKSGIVTGIEETANKVTVLDKTNPSQTNYTSEYAVVNALSAVENVIDGIDNDVNALTQTVATKADKETTYTKIEVDQLVDNAVETSEAFKDLKDLVNTKTSKEYVDGVLEGKADKDNVYNIAVMDQLLADKAHINHTHTISDVDGLPDRLAAIDLAVAKIDDLEDDVDELKVDVTILKGQMDKKADLDSNGKLVQSQIPDNVITTDKLSQALNELITKQYLEERLGVAFKDFVVPMNGQLATLHDTWISDTSKAIWTWTGELDGYIEWNVTDGAITVTSTADESGMFYVTLFKTA